MNNQRDFWQQVLSRVQQGDRCAVLCVVESIGSSPGRRGFKMCVVQGGGMFGSIGGGSMEHKLVELARTLFERNDGFPLLKRQIHQADIGQDRSGMICSGEQTVAFFRLHGEDDRRLVERILQAMDDADDVSGTGAQRIWAYGLFPSEARCMDRRTHGAIGKRCMPNRASPSSVRDMSHWPCRA